MLLNDDFESPKWEPVRKVKIISTENTSQYKVDCLKWSVR